MDRDGERLTLRPKQLVLATGMSGKPSMPTLPGQDVFRGDQHHSSAHPGPDAYVGKQAVVIGSNNSAHDICEALWENGVDVTMVQRSSTHIVRSDSLMELGLGDLYSERAVAAGMTTEKADLTFASLPYRIMHEFQIPVYDAIRERDKDFYDRLAAAGFELDWGDDDSGLFMKYLRRGSGYYIDVGASDLVADGEIKLAHGQVDQLTEDSVVLADGTELPADLVVYATGYGSMNGWAADLIGQDVADKVGKVWGLGSRHDQGPRAVGGRAAQHVEADPAGEPVVPRRQPAPVAALLAVPGAAAQGAPRGHPDAGVRPAGGPSPELTGERSEWLAWTDPYLWLEDVTGDDALDWVRRHNEPTLAELRGERFEQMRAEALEVLDTDARIPYVRRRGDYLYNFWRDAANPRGLWRRTTLDSYRTDAPDWEVLIDVDALAAAEDENWVWAGADVIEPDHSLALDQPVPRRLGRRGRARVRHAHRRIRRRRLRAARGQDADQLGRRGHRAVGTDFGAGSLTDSGYPRLVKRWRRGHAARRGRDGLQRRAHRRDRRGVEGPHTRLRAHASEPRHRLLQRRGLRAARRRAHPHRRAHRRHRVDCTASGC